MHIKAIQDIQLFIVGFLFTILKVKRIGLNPNIYLHDYSDEILHP